MIISPKHLIFVFMNGFVYKLTGLLMTVLLVLSGCSSVSHKARQRVEYLNHRAFDMRYSNLDSVTYYAKQALAITGNYKTGKAEAYNNLALAALMRQDFPTAEQYYSMSEECSNNQLEHLISDVGMMRVTQRTASNKRFFDYYNKASKSIYHLKEEIEALDEHDRVRFTIAESDFHLAASTYFYYMQQEDRAKEELKQLNLYEVAKSDSIQWIYGTYVWGTSGLRESDDTSSLIIDEFDDLLHALYMSRVKGTVYLEANIVQTFSELLTDSVWSKTVFSQRHPELAFINNQEVVDSLLPIKLSELSLEMFQEYGDNYQIAGARRSLSQILFSYGRYEEALEQLQLALNDINDYLLHLDAKMAEDCKLELAAIRDSIPVEVKMLDKYPLRIVPQWLANIRESISMTYSALGDKDASDYNRNIYLDILDRTRQDKELESRFDQLESESAFMGILLVVVLCIVILGIIGFWFLNKTWRKKNATAIERLGRVAALCNSLSSNFPIDEEEVQGQIIGLESEDSSLVDLIQPYQTWASQYAATLAELEESHELLEKERYLHEQHLADNKRQNLEKRTCMSIVYGITPFLDRIMNEVRKLKMEETEEVRQERYLYIRELVDRINEYNDILSLWIRMKQGSLSLHVENFALSDLFETISKGHRTFQQKQQTLDVQSTTACVKADKALTLFIINTLAENARKYTPSGGTVTVKAEQTDQYVEISVSDTGRGLSEADINRILNEKVYDSSQIGLGSADKEANDELRKNKGYGFGLMNCKGIIEKYKKTNALFNVCKFGIESKLGVGSRFFFRLPKGVIRLVALLLFSLFGRMGDVYAQPSERLLEQASRYADSTYYKNVNRDYAAALVYADSACLYLNRYYAEKYAGGTRLMSMSREDGLAELDWWNYGVETDYHVILDIRNEAAVASLATCQWELYKLNNQGYTRLYKLLGEDDSLEAFCRSMQRSASNRILAIWLIVILVVVFLAAYYMLYFRHAQTYRMNMEQALLANRKILNLNRVEDLKPVLDSIYPDLNDIHPIRGLAVLIDDGGKNVFQPVATNSQLITPLVESQLSKCASAMQPIWDNSSGSRFEPLTVEIGGEVFKVGSFAFIQSDTEYSTQDEILNNLILHYLAIMIYQTLIRLTLKQSDVELAEDEKRRTIFEENQLHVQNMMLDNCLSSLKHETMYYPNRIRQMVDLLLKKTGDGVEEDQINAMHELMDYYKEVFTLLSSCASRQIVNVKLNRSKVSVIELFAYMQRYFKKVTKKIHQDWTLTTECAGDCFVVGDEHLLRFMMENLVDAAVQLDGSPSCPGFTMNAEKDGDYIRFSFTDPRGAYTQEYLNALFYPSLERMNADENGRLRGIQYLIARQIIRDHEELCNHRGCRINAEVGIDGHGFVLWFTLRNK